MLSSTVGSLPGKHHFRIGLGRHIIGQIERAKSVLHILTANSDGNMTILSYSKLHTTPFRGLPEALSKGYGVPRLAICCKGVEEQIRLDRITEDLAGKEFHFWSNEDKIIEPSSRVEHYTSCLKIDQCQCSTSSSLLYCRSCLMASVGGRRRWAVDEVLTRSAKA